MHAFLVNNLSVRKLGYCCCYPSSLDPIIPRPLLTPRPLDTHHLLDTPTLLDPNRVFTDTGPLVHGISEPLGGGVDMDNWLSDLLQEKGAGGLRDVINFWKLVAHLGKWPTTLVGLDRSYLVIDGPLWTPTWQPLYIYIKPQSIPAPGTIPVL